MKQRPLGRPKGQSRVKELPSMTTPTLRKTWSNQKASKSNSSSFEYTSALNTTNRRLLTTCKVASKMTPKQSDAHVAKFQAEVEQRQQELNKLVLKKTLDL